MKISVVIPTYNGRKVLARTLPNVLEQDLAPADYEVVVVVDGSTDGTVEFIRTLNPRPVRLRVVEQPNRGPGAARNTGIKAARGELVLLMDDDMLCDPDLARRHVAAHQRAGTNLVFGPVRWRPKAPRVWRRTGCGQISSVILRKYGPLGRTRLTACGCIPTVRRGATCSSPAAVMTKASAGPTKTRNWLSGYGNRACALCSSPIS